MIYKVTKKFAGGSETQVGTYKTLTEAHKIIQEKLAEDQLYKINATYCLYEGFDLVEAFDQTHLVPEPTSNQDTGSGQGKTSSQAFRPTPFNMTPAPKGSPRSWIKDEDENKDKK